MTPIYRVHWEEQISEAKWRDAPIAQMNHWHAEGTQYHPPAFGQLIETHQAFYVRLRCEESKPQAIQSLPNSPVCTDSCLEFFLNPVPEENRFMNFEFNAKGTMLFGINECGQFHCLDPLFHTGCFPHARVSREEWEIQFCIPKCLLHRLFPSYDSEKARKMRGNFYKCGDNTRQPHYGSWSKVTRNPVDFHCPECFGVFLLERNEEI